MCFHPAWQSDTVAAISTTVSLSLSFILSTSLSLSLSFFLLLSLSLPPVLVCGSQWCVELKFSIGISSFPYVPYTSLSLSISPSLSLALFPLLPPY